MLIKNADTRVSLHFTYCIDTSAIGTFYVQQSEKRTAKCQTVTTQHILNTR